MKGLKVIIFSAIFSLIVSLTLNYFNICYSKNWWWSLLFFLVIFITTKLLFAQKRQPESGADILIGTIWIKLILLLVAVFIYSLIDKNGLFRFSMHFMTHYILFTVFEIRYLLSKIKNETAPAEKK